MSTEMAITPVGQRGVVGIPRNMADLNVIVQIASVLVKSGFMPQHIRTEQAAAAIIMMGAEFGLSYWTSINNINVINGKPAASPQLMLALINASGMLENVEFDCTDERALVTMKRVGRTQHTETFSFEDAVKLGLSGKDNYKKQPKTMLKWRAVAACARVVFGDVILGLYTPEELGADTVVDDEGNMTVIGEVEEVRQTTPPLAVVSKPNTTTNATTTAPQLVERGNGSAAGAAAVDGDSAEKKHWMTVDDSKQRFAAYWRKMEFTEKGKPQNVDWKAALKETSEMLGHQIKGFSELDLTTFPSVDTFIAAMNKHFEGLKKNSPLQNSKAFVWTEAEIAQLDAWCQSNFENSAELILISASVQNPRMFVSPEIARAKIIEEVIERRLPVTAREVTYAGKGKPIMFITAIGNIAFHAGRTKLKEMFADYDDVGFGALKDDGLSGKHVLDKVVSVGWEKRGEGDASYYELTSIAISFSDIPF